MIPKKAEDLSNNQDLSNNDIVKNDLNAQDSDEKTTSNDLKEFLYLFGGGILISVVLIFGLYIFINKYSSELPSPTPSNLEVYNNENQEEENINQISFEEIGQNRIEDQNSKDLEQVKEELRKTQRILENIQQSLQEEKKRRIEAELQRDVVLKLFKEQTQEYKTIYQSSINNSGYPTENIVRNLGKFIVKIGCFDKNGNIAVGSGIIYGTEYGSGKNIILTNYHIIDHIDYNLDTPCFVFYSDDPTQEFTDFYFATPIFFLQDISLNEMEFIDFAFLRLEKKFKFNDNREIEIIPNASLKITDYTPRICKNNEIKIGDEILVLGYPLAGSDYLTITEGIISGYDGDFYLVTSAKIDKGNSGGGAFSKSRGCLLGMPTFSIKGGIESFARLINMAYLEQNFLSKIFQ